MARSHSPSIEALLEPLYASVLDPARFEDFAGLLRKAMNGHLVALQTDDASHRHNVLTHFWEYGPDAQPPDYVNDASINLFFARGAQAFAARGVLDGSTLFAPGELERTAFYREVLTVLDVQHSMGFLLAAEPQGPKFGLRIHGLGRNCPLLLYRHHGWR
jgi:hypothetical protein